MAVKQTGDLQDLVTNRVLLLKLLFQFSLSPVDPQKQNKTGALRLHNSWKDFHLLSHRNPPPQIPVLPFHQQTSFSSGLFPFRTEIHKSGFYQFSTGSSSSSALQKLDVYTGSLMSNQDVKLVPNYTESFFY